MHSVKLLQLAKEKLDEGDAAFAERVSLVLAILRSKGCVPFLRSKLNGDKHRAFAAAIILAHDTHDSIDLHSRRHGDLHFQGITTLLPTYLDRCIKAGLLQCDHPKAKGKITVGPLLSAYLSDNVCV